MACFEKRSFLKLPIKIDADAMLSEYRSVPREAWNASSSDVHTSTDFLLLRGGNAGTVDDFCASHVVDSPFLNGWPYISSLLSPSGPFGGATYAFIFRMKPFGVSYPHFDGAPEWKEPFRIHVPIITNHGAFLLAAGRSIHFGVGEAWTFDNQSLHAAINGEQVRTHLIFDVRPNPALEELLRSAEWHPGDKNCDHWARAYVTEAPMLMPAKFSPLSRSEKISLGLNPEGFATRVLPPSGIARFVTTPMQTGDIIYAVNQVEECEMSVTVWGHIRLHYRPGDTVELGLIRGTSRLNQKLTLASDPTPYFHGARSKSGKPSSQPVSP